LFIPPAGLPERGNIGSLDDTMNKNYLSNIFCLKERSQKKIWFTNCEALPNADESMKNICCCGGQGMLDTGYWMLENGVTRTAQVIPQRQHVHRVSPFLYV
jgi:hypothetical protein